MVVVVAAEAAVLNFCSHYQLQCFEHCLEAQQVLVSE
jgi:hypothetical protein